MGGLVFNGGMGILYDVDSSFGWTGTGSYTSIPPYHETAFPIALFALVHTGFPSPRSVFVWTIVILLDVRNRLKECHIICRLSNCDASFLPDGLIQVVSRIL